MFDYINGDIEEISPSHIVVDNRGVGYFLNISLNTFTELKNEKFFKVYTHFVVREDAHSLYGFSTKSERAVFRKLISVSGIGASIAMMMLSSLSPDEVVNAILIENVNLIKQVKGIGPKTAQRVILELKDKIAKDDTILTNKNLGEGNTLKNEALSALAVLGFDGKKAQNAVEKAFGSKSGQIENVEELIKLSLKNL